jgi:hypothetical protein
MLDIYRFHFAEAARELSSSIVEEITTETQEVVTIDKPSHSCTHSQMNMACRTGLAMIKGLINRQVSSPWLVCQERVRG